MFKTLLGVAFGIYFGFNYAVSNVEIDGLSRQQLQEMKDVCERLQPRTIHCVPVVKYKAVGVPSGARNVPRLNSYDSSLDTDGAVFDEPVTQKSLNESYDYRSDEVDPVLKKSWLDTGFAIPVPSWIPQKSDHERKIKNDL